MGKNVWTVPHEVGWANRTEGSQRVGSTYPTKSAAVDAGREQARANRSEHIIQRGDGSIQGRNSYGNDPHPPRG